MVQDPNLKIGATHCVALSRKVKPGSNRGAQARTHGRACTLTLRYGPLPVQKSQWSDLFPRVDLTHGPGDGKSRSHAVIESGLTKPALGRGFHGKKKSEAIRVAALRQLTLERGSRSQKKRSEHGRIRARKYLTLRPVLPSLRAIRIDLRDRLTIPTSPGGMVNSGTFWGRWISFYLTASTTDLETAFCKCFPIPPHI